MKLIFDSCMMIPNICESVTHLTNKAKIDPNNIQYDKENKTIKIIIKRKKVLGFKKSFLTFIEPIYGNDEINSILIIKKVICMNIKNKFNTEFTVLFGIQFRGNMIYLSSAEEIKGEPVYQIFINVEGISIELFDI